ncbi:MAG: PD-(D/E)XK nuclease family transposase, partial [Lachnospiraceae bacterium]|nr:PD-(D/E)XK nuclease family transposase [Lachnospiraceae bacterium]
MHKAIIKSTVTAENLFGKEKSRDEVINELKAMPDTYATFLELTEEMQEQAVSFLMGKRSVEILYDNFFQKIFNPEIHQERVERLISALIGEKVRIKQILSRKGSQLTERGSMVIMDIIVELEDGSFVDVEIQKIGYRFPSQRSSCYVSDMIM